MSGQRRPLPTSNQEVRERLEEMRRIRLINEERRRQQNPPPYAGHTPREDLLPPKYNPKKEGNGKNTGKNYRLGPVKKRTQIYNGRTKMYVKRDKKTGQFMANQKKKFKGVISKKMKGSGPKRTGVRLFDSDDDDDDDKVETPDQEVERILRQQALDDEAKERMLRKYFDGEILTGNFERKPRPKKEDDDEDYQRGTKRVHGKGMAKKKIRKILKKILKGRGPKEVPVKRKMTPEERAQKKKEKKDRQTYLSKNRMAGVKMDLYEERGGIRPDIKPNPPVPRIQRERAVFDLRDEMSGKGKGRSFLHDAAHGIFKVLPVITALASIINKLGISSKPEEWVAKATDYLKGNETQRQYIQEDIDTAQPNDYGWKELYAFKKAGYTLPERLSDQLAKQMDEDTRKYEYLQANPIQITAEQQQTQQYKTASQLFIDKYAKELNKFLALSNADFNAQKNNIRLREINIKRSNYLYKSPVLDDLLSKINIRLGQVGAGPCCSKPKIYSMSEDERITRAREMLARRNPRPRIHPRNDDSDNSEFGDRRNEILERGAENIARNNYDIPSEASTSGSGKRTNSLRRILNTKLTPKYLRKFTKDEILEKLYEAQSLFDYFSKKTHKINQAQYLQLQNIMRILEDVYYRLP